jgi:putative transposase
MQKETFAQWFGSCRYIYNVLLDTYKNSKVPGKIKMQKDVKELKEKDVWLKAAPSQALQISSHNLKAAYKKAWEADTKKNRAIKIAQAQTDKQKAQAFDYGFPKFKSRKDNDQSFTLPQKVTLNSGFLSIPKMKDKIKIIVHRELPEKYTLGKVTISRKGDNYFASLCVDDLKEIPAKTSFEKSVGIDLGLKSFAYLSKPLDGITDFKKPDFLKLYLEKLQYLDKKLSKLREKFTLVVTKRGKTIKEYSKNYYKLLKKRNRLYDYITNRRTDFLHKLSFAITKQFDCVCVENLNIRKMMHDCYWARDIGDAGWGEFLRQLEYKCEWKGKYFVQLDPYIPTTKVCSKCRTVVDTIPLSVRRWTCPVCGTVHHRDENASHVIELKGLEYLKKSLGMVLAEVTSVESDARKGPQGNRNVSLREEMPPLKSRRT